MMKKLLVFLSMTAAIVVAAHAQDVAGTYTGTMALDLMGSVTEQDATIRLEATEDGEQYNIIVENFSYGGYNLGDLEVSNVSVSEEADGTVVLTKDEEFEGPSVSMVTTTVKSTSATVKDGTLDLDFIVSVTIASSTTLEVNVSFQGTIIQSGLSAVAAEKTEIKVWGMGNSMTVKGAQTYTIYNAAGVPVQQGAADGSIISLDNLGNGIYLVKAGNTVTKFVKR